MGGKVLVLDVDETLLNIEPLFFLEKFKNNYKKYNGRLINFNGIKQKYYLVARPRIKEFIEEATKHFKLVAFSTADREITEEKLKLIGIKDFFIRIYGKEDLINKAKSLAKVSKDLNVDINNIIAIDDIPKLFIEQDRVIKIKPWYIGDDESYEFKNNKDNLFGVLEQAKIL